MNPVCSILLKWRNNDDNDIIVIVNDNVVNDNDAIILSNRDSFKINCDFFWYDKRLCSFDGMSIITSSG